jgi:coenzyme F420-0:L-glutamate ligase / coenzyme F420-1:gamma-L-glutamate ligase
MNDPSRLEVVAVSWPEVAPGDDLATMIVESMSLADGDIVVLTSKAVSKAEGCLVVGDRRDVVVAQTRRVLARRGDAVIAETAHGLVMAAAGVDASNTPAGTALTLPRDPDGTARALREQIRSATGTNVAILITDTLGRAWRNGQMDLAVGCAGMIPLNELHGTLDTHGNVLNVTAPALADELASTADLVKGKTSGRPVAVVRGLAHLVLAPEDHGSGAVSLIRASNEDLFGLGTREAAVAAALRDDDVALAHFPPRFPVDPEPFAGLVSDHDDVQVVTTVPTAGGPAAWEVQVDVRDGAGIDAWMAAGRLWERCEVLAVAHRLREDAASGGPDANVGWHTVVRTRWIVA